jgi:hypothetical protein
LFFWSCHNFYFCKYNILQNIKIFFLLKQITIFAFQQNFKQMTKYYKAKVKIDFLETNEPLTKVSANKYQGIDGLEFNIDDSNVEDYPTWCDLIQQERYQLLGELIDAMIYSPKAVIEVQQLVNSFKERGLVKSIINPKVIEYDSTMETTL